MVLKKFFLWLFSPFPEAKSSTPYVIDELSELRVRDLRKILYGFGISREEVKRYLDKEELLQTAFTLLEEERVTSLTALRYAQAWRFTVIAMIITLIYISREPLGALGQQVQNHFLMVRYNLKVKVDMVKVAMNTKIYLAIISLLVAMVLDVIYEWIQLSIFASWVVPHDAIFLRQMMFPFHINFPISAGMLMGENMRRTDFGQQLGGFGINLGPMILMAALRYLKHHMQEYGAGCIHNTVFDKARRREERKRRKMDDQVNEDQDDSPAPRDVDTPPSAADSRSHLPSWPRKPPHMREADGFSDNAEDFDIGYYYSNDNDPGSEAAAKEIAEAEYRAQMAATQAQFAKYLEMKAAEAKEAEAAAAVRRKEMEDILAGPDAGAEFQFGNAEGWADELED